MKEFVGCFMKDAAYGFCSALDLGLFVVSFLAWRSEASRKTSSAAADLVTALFGLFRCVSLLSIFIVSDHVLYTYPLLTSLVGVIPEVFYTISLCLLIFDRFEQLRDNLRLNVQIQRPAITRSGGGSYSSYSSVSISNMASINADVPGDMYSSGSRRKIPDEQTRLLSRPDYSETLKQSSLVYLPRYSSLGICAKICLHLKHTVVSNIRALALLSSVGIGVAEIVFVIVKKRETYYVPYRIFHTVGRAVIAGFISLFLFICFMAFRKVRHATLFAFIVVLVHGLESVFDAFFNGSWTSCTLHFTAAFSYYFLTETLPLTIYMYSLLKRNQKLALERKKEVLLAQVREKLYSDAPQTPPSDSLSPRPSSLTATGDKQLGKSQRKYKTVTMGHDAAAASSSTSQSPEDGKTSPEEHQRTTEKLTSSERRPTREKKHKKHKHSSLTSSAPNPTSE